MGHWHVHLARAARWGGRDALARHLRPRRRVGHAGVDRSRERRRLCADGAALEFPEQRRQRRPPPFPAGGHKRTRETVRFKVTSASRIPLRFERSLRKVTGFVIFSNQDSHETIWTRCRSLIRRKNSSSATTKPTHPLKPRLTSLLRNCWNGWEQKQNQLRNTPGTDEENWSMTEPEKLIPPHGGYRKLKSFQVAQLVYDVTVRFCDRYIGKRSRTHDQMVQAARSGGQNIAEGSKASGTAWKQLLWNKAASQNDSTVCAMREEDEGAD